MSIRLISGDCAQVLPTFPPESVDSIVTDPVLDLFAGSGTTLIAAHEEGFDSIGIEAEADYAAIADSRLQERGIDTELEFA